ncbi:MAG: efflux RND transporter periplasmic adaptor subunit [Moritella sp.]|uniref:efflux RND transporter periplasmic adaptor subunit n=1 Tax=Moritella sp. TaxID=78556 RepID=UPI0029B0EECF|nr:efflux RND transporter periplasmic adaptor subunit [Moritella sp.]MDX2322100.1 efflux RND transporter periplasmic adaptor subunit [Moritella sp.]
MKGILATTVISSLLISGCSEEQVVIPEPDSRPVKIQAVDVGIKDTFRTFPGIVEAGDKAVLAFRVSGLLSSIDVRPGENVVKGQTLASLNKDEFLLQVEQAQANYELSSVQFKRDAKLRKTNVVSELAFDTSKAKRNQAQAALSKQESNLGYATLEAPYDGTLSLSLKENHEYVMAKEPVMHIQRAGIINITFQLPEQLLVRFDHGYSRRPIVIFDTIPGEEFPAKFKEIDTEANATNSSYKVTLFMDRPENKNILPGMAGAVRIALPKGNVGTLPPQALMKKDDAYFVWQIDDQGLAHKREIELDANGRVTKGLNDGDNVAISGVTELREGQKVRSWIKERGL